jgi:hypothetical protein
LNPAAESENRPDGEARVDAGDAVNGDATAIARWRRIAADATENVRERIARYAELPPRDREKFVRRMREVIDNALEVPPDLPERAVRRAGRLRSARPDQDPVAIAWSRTRERARSTAAIGAVTAVPTVVPGLGAPLAALGLVADWRYAAEQQRNLILEIAALFGVMPSDPSETVHALFLASTATAFGSTAAGDAVVRVLGRQIARRSASRLVPGVGAVAAGSLNYVATVGLGRFAIRHFADQAGIELRGLVPEAVHPAMPWLRNATIAAFENEAVLAGTARPFADEDYTILPELSDADREELLDLAAAATTGSSPPGDPRERVLHDIARDLGFSPEDVEEVRSTFRGEVRRFATRLARLVSTAGAKSGNAAQTLWRRAGRLARRR